MSTFRVTEVCWGAVNRLRSSAEQGCGRQGRRAETVSPLLKFVSLSPSPRDGDRAQVMSLQSEGA